MPQLNGADGDDLGANDELIAFKDEGEREEKRNVSAEGDLDDVKSSLVNESETNSSSDSEVSLTGDQWRQRSSTFSLSPPPPIIAVGLTRVCQSSTSTLLICLCLRSCAGRQTPQAQSRFGEQGQTQSAVRRRR